MASEMVERVARAMMENIRKQMDASLGLAGNPTAWTAEGGSINLEETAQAAIEEMRRPTVDMIEAGQVVNNLLPEDRDPPNAFLFLSRDEMTEAWVAMIDAALKG